MKEHDLQKLLTPRDRSILDAQAGTSWVPKEPRELLLPYVDSTDKIIDRTSTEGRLQKAKEVYDNYGKIIEECRELEDEIEYQCNTVSITLDPSNNLQVIEAVRRVFGTDGRQITFDMYKKCIKALADSNNKKIPRPRKKE